MERSFLIRQIFFTGLFLFSLTQFSFADNDSFTVNVPNSQGGYTAITIKQSGNGYIGPKGEQYSGFPTVSQLQAVYAVSTTNPPVVAAAPVVAEQPSSSDQETFTVNIVNPTGGYTPVIVKKSGNGYIGPKGEQYSGFPTVSQLQSVYAAGTFNSANVATAPVETKPQEVYSSGVTTPPVVVTAPVVSEQPSSLDQESIVINIVNPKGGLTPVVIKKYGKTGTYLGPCGEQYFKLPTAADLQFVYSDGVPDVPATGIPGLSVTTPVKNARVQLMNGQQAVVNITKSSGVVRAIVITKSDFGYRGPLGETYSEFPSAEQLQIAYENISDEDILESKQNPSLLTRLLNDQVAKNEQARVSRQQKENEEKQKKCDQQGGCDSITGLTVDEQNKISVIQSRAAQLERDRIEREAKLEAQKEREKFLKNPLAKEYWSPLACFMSTIILLVISWLVFCLLVHMPNRLIKKNQWEGVGIVDAIRKGVTQANFNSKFYTFINYEILFIAFALGMYFKSWLAAGVVVFMFCVYMPRTLRFIIVYLLNACWGLCGAELGFLLCGGQFANLNNYISAWIGGFVFYAIAFAIVDRIHNAGMQFGEDLG